VALDIQISQNPNSIEIKLSGELALLDTAELKHSVTDLLGEKSFENLEINLTNLSYIDSSGLGTLFFIKKKTDALGIELKLSHVQSQVREVFRLGGMDKLFELGE
jgi:anti-sigma B factor antagonist